MTIAATRHGFKSVLLAGMFTLALTGGALMQARAAEAPAPAPAAAATAAAPAATGHGSADNMNFLTIVMRAGWFGMVIWISLFVCSIIAVALIIDSYVTIQEKKIAPKQLVSDVRDALAQGDLLKALQHCENTPVPLSRILKAGFSNAEEGFEVVQDAVGVAADMEGEMLMERVTYLSVISNTTPMLGLIGTVQGMIFAFFNLGTAAAGAAQTNMLAVNISHGLWATAVGLGTAVPAGIYYFFFKMRCTRIILHQEALTLDLIKTLRNVEVVHD
ncbi:MAG: MotA/TolQ/ExbB proton channel family protein [bacterium]